MNPRMLIITALVGTVSSAAMIAFAAPAARKESPDQENARHAQAMLDPTQGAVALVGRVGSRDKIDDVEVQLVVRFVSKDEVTNVDGIKGAAKDANAFAALRNGYWFEHRRESFS